LKKLVSMGSGLAILFLFVVGVPRSASAVEEIFWIGADGRIWTFISNAGGGSAVPLGNGTVTVTSLGESISGGSVAGGTALGTVGILAAAGLIAVGATIAIDCATHDQCIWTVVNDAGGWGVVLGISPNPSAQPIPGAVTVNCSDPTPLATQCRNSSLQNSITGYSSWFGGSYWTCGQVWANGATTGSADWMNALNSCNAQAALCVASTMNVCQANNIPRADLQAVALNLNVCSATDKRRGAQQKASLPGGC
jgi:hypothetical protein